MTYLLYSVIHISHPMITIWRRCNRDINTESLEKFFADFNNCSNDDACTPIIVTSEDTRLQDQ